MNKIFALYKNELIKISKKASVLIILISMIIGLFVIGGLLKFIDTMNSQGNDSMYSASMDEWNQQDMQTQITMFESSIVDTQSQLDKLQDTQEDQTQRTSLEEDILSITDQIDMYKLGLEEKIYLNGSQTYLVMTLNSIPQIKSEIRALEMLPEEMRDETWQMSVESKQQIQSDYMSIIENRSFEDYITLSEQIIEADASLSASDKQIKIESSQLWMQIDPSGGLEGKIDPYLVSNVLQQVELIKRSVEDKNDYTSEGQKPMSPSEVEDMKNQLSVIEYYIENNSLSLDNASYMRGNSLSVLFAFGTFMIVIMALILAGGSISQEVSSGSIKSLIIAPVKRWKIFTAKMMSLVTVSLAAVFVLFGFGMLSFGLFFGFDGNLPYVYASHGTASAIPFSLYQLGLLLVSYIDILVYMTLAFMLSVLGRNTAAAVGISIAGYFGSGIVQQFLAILTNYEFLKFLPFSNMGLQSRFFPFSNVMQSLSYGSFSSAGSFNQPSLIFSLVYLFVILFCMCYTSMDSFNRRDIK